MDLPSPAPARFDFADARNRMVDSQIRPNKVTNPRILNAMREHPARAVSCRRNMIARAYADEDVPLGGGRALDGADGDRAAAPARGAPAGAAGAGGRCGSGLRRGGARRLRRVGRGAREATRPCSRWRAAALAATAPTVKLVSGPLADGWPPEAPYDIILIEGAVRDIPAALGPQLGPRRADRHCADGAWLDRQGRDRGGDPGRPARAGGVRLRDAAARRPAAAPRLRLLSPGQSGLGARSGPQNIGVCTGRMAHLAGIGGGSALANGVTRGGLAVLGIAGLGLALLPAPAAAQQATRLGASSSSPGDPQRFATRPPPPSPAVPSGLGPRTLAEALAASYANNPQLQAARAQLRAMDENVPQALAGWRPTVVVAGTAGYGDGYSRQFLTSLTRPPAEGRRVQQFADRPRHRDGASDGHAAALPRRPHARLHQPRREPGSRPARPADRAGTDRPSPTRSTPMSA